MKRIITPAGKSVLEELDLDPAFIAKAKLAIRITISIAEMGLTQRQAAARMPMPSLNAMFPELLASADRDGTGTDARPSNISRLTNRNRSGSRFAC